MNDEVESAVLSLLRERKYFDFYSATIEPEFFSNEYASKVYTYICSYMEQYRDKTTVSKRNLKLLIEETGEDRKIVKEYISSLTNIVSLDEELVVNKITEFIKLGIIRNTIKRSFSAYEGKKPFELDHMLAELRRAKEFELVTRTTYDYTEETESLHRTFKHKGDKIFTGIKVLDDALIYPPTTGEEWIILGPPGRGKTQFLLNIVANAACQGKKTLYISAGDQGREQIQSRLDSIISEIPFLKLLDPSSRVLGLLRKRVKEKVTSNGGKILIQDWSDTSCTVDQVEALIISLRDIDLVAVDYPDIMKASQHYKERRHEIASIFGDLRKVGVKHGVLIWAGSQANRISLDKKSLDLRNLAEDIQKAWVADGIVAYCQTPEEKEDEIARLSLPKARRPPLKSYEVDITIDPDTGRIF